MRAIPMRPSTILKAIWTRPDRTATAMRTTPTKIKPSAIAMPQEYRMARSEN